MHDIHESAGVLFKISDSQRQMQIRVPFSGTQDDVFAVRLAIQFARNGGVTVRVINVVGDQISATKSAFYLGKHQPSVLEELQSELDETDKANITFEDVNAAGSSAVVLDALLLNDSSETGDITIIMGRNVYVSSTHDTASSSQILEKPNVLGPWTNNVVARMKTIQVAASLLVVQAKSSGSQSQAPQVAKHIAGSQESLSTTQ